MVGVKRGGSAERLVPVTQALHAMSVKAWDKATNPSPSRSRPVKKDAGKNIINLWTCIADRCYFLDEAVFK